MTDMWSATVYEANGHSAAVLGVPDRTFNAGSALTDVTVALTYPIEEWDPPALEDLIRQAQGLDASYDPATYDEGKVFRAFECSSERDWKAALRCEVRVYRSDDQTWEIDAIGRIKRGEGVRARVILNEVAPTAERLAEAFAEAVAWSRRITAT